MKFFKILLCAGVLASLHCGSKKDSGLSIVAIPSSPFLVAYGSGTTTGGGYFKLTPGYFTFSSFNVTWSGTNGNLTVVAIIVQSLDQTGNTTKVNCAFAGDDLKVIFPGNTNSTTGATVIPQATTTPANPVLSGPSGCGGVTLPTVIPSQFNIPAVIKIEGVVVNANNNTVGRAEGTTNITIQ